MVEERTMGQWYEMLMDMNQCLTAAGPLAFSIAHNYRAIYAKVSDYLETRNSIIAKYGEKDKVSGEYTITDPDDIRKANLELLDYSELKVSCDLIKIPETALKDCNLNAAQLLKIHWMIEDSPSEKLMEIVYPKSNASSTIQSEEEANNDTDEGGEPYDPKSPVTDPRFV